MRRTVIALLLCLGPGSAFAMGEVPGDENLCKEILAMLGGQSVFLSADAVAFAESYRAQALARQAELEASLDMVDAELQLEGSWNPSDEETGYLQLLDTSLAILQLSISHAEAEILCWDEVLRHPRIPNPPKPPLQMILQPGEAKPPPLPDPDDPIGLGELWDMIADYNGWQRLRAEDLQEQVEDRQQDVQAELDRRATWTDGFESGSLDGWIGISGGAGLPLNEPDFGATQEIDETPGAAVEIDGGVSFDVGAPWRIELGAGAGWRRQGLDQLLNKNAPGSLPLDGHDGGFYGLGKVGLVYEFGPDGYLRLGGGVGAAQRHLDLSANGNQVVDDSDTVLLWRVEAAGGWRVCDCGLFLEGLVRYEGLGEADVTSEADVPFTLGAQRSLMLGVGLRYQWNY